MRRGRQGRHRKEKVKQPKHRPLRRKIHIGETVWTWQVENGGCGVVIVNPEGSQKWRVPGDKIDAETYWDDIDEDQVPILRPGNIKDYIEEELLKSVAHPQLSNNYRRMSGREDDGFIYDTDDDPFYDTVESSRGWTYGKGGASLWRFVSRRLDR